MNHPPAVSVPAAGVNHQTRNLTNHASELLNLMSTTTNPVKDAPPPLPPGSESTGATPLAWNDVLWAGHTPLGDTNHEAPGEPPMPPTCTTVHQICAHASPVLRRSESSVLAIYRAQCCSPPGGYIPKASDLNWSTNQPTGCRCVLIECTLRDLELHLLIRLQASRKGGKHNDRHNGVRHGPVQQRLLAVLPSTLPVITPQNGGITPANRKKMTPSRPPWSAPLKWSTGTRMRSKSAK